MRCPSPTASSMTPFAASPARTIAPDGAPAAKMNHSPMMSPRSAAKRAPELGFFQADFPTQTASITTSTAAPATRRSVSQVHDRFNWPGGEVVLTPSAASPEARPADGD